MARRPVADPLADARRYAMLGAEGLRLERARGDAYTVEQGFRQHRLYSDWLTEACRAVRADPDAAAELAKRMLADAGAAS